MTPEARTRDGFGLVLKEGEVIGEVVEISATVLYTQTVTVPERVLLARAPDMPVTFTVTSEWSRPRLWTRLWCALWWGHRPVAPSLFHLDFARDELRCRCGKVAAPAEEVRRKLGEPRRVRLGRASLRG